MQTKTLAVILQRMLALFLIIYGIIHTFLPLLISSINLPDFKNFLLICLLGPFPQIAIGVVLWLLAPKIAGLMVHNLPEEKLSFNIQLSDCYSIAILLVGLFTTIKAVVILLPNISQIPHLRTPFLNPHNYNIISGAGMLLIGIIMIVQASFLGKFIANFGRKKQDSSSEL